MTILSFTYTKADSSVSERDLLVMVKPNTMYEGLDISELSAEEQAAMAAEVGAAHDAYLVALEAIKTKFDVRRNYRRFDPTKMTNITQE